MPSLVKFSLIWIFTSVDITFADSTKTIIETTLLVNIDNAVETSERRYSSSYQTFGKENLISQEIDNSSLDPNSELGTSLDLIFATLTEGELFNALDHAISYTVDLKNNGSYGDPKIANQVIDDNLHAIITSCIKRSLVLNLDTEATLQDISTRIIENFVLNDKAIINWKDSAAEWIENLSKTFIKSALDSNLPLAETELFDIGSKAFTGSVLSLYNLNQDAKFNEIQLYPGIEPVSNQPSLANETMLFGGENEGYYKFDPIKTKIISSTAAGLIYVATEKAIIASIANPEDYDQVIVNTINSINQTYFDFVNKLNGDHSLFIYESSKSIAMGIASSSLKTVFDYGNQSQKLSTENFIENITSHIATSSITNSLNSTKILIPDLAESIANGVALGTQITTILNNESAYNDSLQGLNRDTFAMHSSKGVAQGTIKATSLNIDQFVANSGKKADSFVSEVASHSAKGSVYGNTTIGIYNKPPKELLSIINLSAQGAAEGSTNVLELNNVDKSQEATEDVVVQVARASAHGSSLAASFGMSALDEAKPDKLSYDRKTIAAVESASYGSAYGAIIGSINNGTPDTVVIKQASKQGSTEGALIGAGLGTRHDEDFFNAEDKSYIDAELNSKKNIIKVVADSSSNAANSANTSRATKTIKSNSKNMIMLMRKFNISPRTTNPSRIFQKNKSSINFDSDFPLKDKFRAASPI